MLRKKLFPILSTILLVGALPLTTNAAVLTKNVQANYHDVKVVYNGSTVSTDIEPFIVNGTTYIPVRMMAGVFNKDIAWDGTTYTIKVNDKADPRISSLEASLAEKESEIKDLEEQLQDAKDSLADYEDDEDDVGDEISDLEDNLNDDYGDYKGLDWDISLSGDEDDISVEIGIDLDEYEDDYGDLDSDDINNLVEDICNDIWDEFEDADIDGVIIDSYEDDDLHDFDGDASSGDIQVDGDDI